MRRVLLKTSISTLVLAIAVPALAQDKTVLKDEIIVTAQKREQNVRDVPVTMTAFRGDFLKEIGVSEFDELSLFTPGLTVQEQSPNNPGFVIRGITSDSGSAQIAPRVTIYLNGVDVSRSRGSYFDLFDIERIETVKGPQATLFGTAAAIGAISVITAKPEEGFSAELTGEAGNFNNFRTSGFVNGGNDRLMGRLAWSYKTRDGYVKNIAGSPGSQTPNGPKIDDLNGQDSLGLRGSLRFVPNDRMQFDLIGTLQHDSPPGTSFKSSVFAPTGGDTNPNSFAELGGFPSEAAFLGGKQPGLNRDVYDLNLTAKFDLNDRFALTSISGYRKFDSVEVFDADGTQATYLEFTEDATGDQFSQEFRLNFDSGDRLHAFAGVSFFHEDGQQSVPFATEEGVYLQCVAHLIPGLPCIAPNGEVTAEQATAILTGGAATELVYHSKFANTGNFDTYSAYADASFAITDRLEATAGLRYVYENRKSGFFSTQPNSVITGAPLLPVVNTNGVEVSASGNFNAFLPRFNLLYRASDEVNFYATVAKGRRSNVIDVNAVAGAATPTPRVNQLPAEIIWNYEGGVKTALFDGRLQASLGAFYQTYKNFQVTVIDNTGRFVPSNAGSASNFGVEAELNADLNDFIAVFGNLAYIDANIDNDPANGVFAGNRFRLQPKWAGAIGARVHKPVSENIEFFLTPTLTFESRKFFELPNKPNISEGSVTLVNVRAGFGTTDGTWKFEGYATNLFDKEYVIDGGNTGGAFGIPTFIAGAPRFYGATITRRF